MLYRYLYTIWWWHLTPVSYFHSSDAVVQIVDARNPLLFRCEDLEKYVKEVDPDKENMILINKADFLTEEQRWIWAKYFDSKHVKVAFFSAIQDDSVTVSSRVSSDSKHQPEIDIVSTSEALTSQTSNNEDVDMSHEFDSRTEVTSDTKECEGTSAVHEEDLSCEHENSKDSDSIHSEEMHSETDNRIEQTTSQAIISDENFCSADQSMDRIKNSGNLLTREELIQLFKSVHKTKKILGTVTTIGLVGYPNVGKSSTINALLMYKKVSVSSTPGKTKHFQVIILCFSFFCNYFMR